VVSALDDCGSEVPNDYNNVSLITQACIIGPGFDSAFRTSQEHGLFEKLLRKLTPGMHQLSIQTQQVILPNGASHAHFALVPGPGRHIFRYRNAFIQVHRVREKMMDITTGKPFETITLTTLYSHRAIFESLFLECYGIAQQAQQGKTLSLHILGNRMEAIWAAKAETRTGVGRVGYRHQRAYSC